MKDNFNYMKDNFKLMFKDLKSGDKEKIKRQIPNTLTTIRGVLAPILIIIALILDSMPLTFTIIALSALTDSFDGWYARKNGYVSEFGALLDAMCDKMFILCVILPVLAKNDLLIIILVIEILIALVNSFLKVKNKEVKSSIIGKVKTVILDFGLVLCYLGLLIQISNNILNIFLVLTIIMQIITLIDYFNNGVKQMEKDKSKKTTRIIGIGLIIFLSILSLVFYIIKNTNKYDGIYGKWYESTGGYIEVYVFLENGTYYKTLEEYEKDKNQDYQKYTYDEEKNIIKFVDFNETATIKLSKEKLELTYKEYDETHILYRSRKQAQINDPLYYMTDEYTDTIIDSKGFCIKDGVLYAYRGKEKSIIVPSDVKVIYHEAFAGDFNHGVNLEKVVIPGTVKEIKSNAFAFTNADYIYIEEGVETLGNSAFMDSYIKEVHFPRSLKNIGDGILETEEGLSDAKIYVPKDSLIEKYFEEYEPYGHYELIVK